MNSQFAGVDLQSSLGFNVAQTLMVRILFLG